MINKSTHEQAKATFINNETHNNPEQNSSNALESEAHNNENENTHGVNTESNEVTPNANPTVNVDSGSPTGNDNSDINTISTNNNPMLFAIDVNITEENSEKLEIFKNDNIDDVVAVFCTKFGLDDEKKTLLRSLIDERLHT